MHVRLFDLYAALVVVAAVLAGNHGQQLAAVAVAGLLVAHRVAVTHAGRPTVRPLHPAQPVLHP